MSYFFNGAKLKVQKKASNFLKGVSLFQNVHTKTKEKIPSQLKLLAETVLNEAFSSERLSNDHV